MTLCIQEHFDLEVVDYYSPGFSIMLTDTEPRSEKDEAETATMLYANGLITRNEGRTRVGQEPIVNGDAFLHETKSQLGQNSKITENSEGRNKSTSSYGKTAVQLSLFE